MKRLFFLSASLLIPFLFADMANASSLSDTSKVNKLDSIIVSAVRAGANTPVTFSTISKAQLRSVAASHSLPMVLGFQPSVVATTEGGLGLGYSKFSVRGSDASRINVTLNGIAINDAESQEVFWVDIPSLGSSLQSVQLQRGVGTSTNGPGAFGASMNMQTLTPAQHPYGNAEFSFGSFKTYMTTIGAGTGEMKNGLSFDVRYSHNSTKGYIRNAKADLNSLYLSGGWKNENNSLKITYIYGDQATGITWNGCPLDVYYKNRRYNNAGEYYDEAGNVHYYDNETDNYRQHHVQLHYIHQFSPYVTFDATVHYTKGTGYYENYIYNKKFSKYGLENQTIDGVTHKKGDFIVRQYMNNDYVASAANVNYNKNKINATAGAAYSFYNGDHFGRVKWSKYNQNVANNFEWYRNNGKKNDVSIYARAEYEIVHNLTAFADLQYRYIFFKLSGMDKDFTGLDRDMHYNFFNPKAGLTYNITDNSKVYFSVAAGHREPSRSDVKESIKAGKADAIKSERMIDYELGYKFANEHVNAGINLYAMEYKNQLVATGKLTETGYTIQENIPDSYRRGVELSAGWMPLEKLSLEGNITFSKNKLKNYTLYTDTYDNPNDWNSVPQTATYYKKSNLTLSPELIGAAMLSYMPVKTAVISLNGKYVGKQYMDNSSSKEAEVPSYFVMGLNAQKSFKIKGTAVATLSICVDNLLNNKYYSYGWIYRAKFKDGSADNVSGGVYAQATTNFIVRLSFNF